MGNSRQGCFRRLPARFFYSGDLNCLEKYRRRRERNVERSNGQLDFSIREMLIQSTGRNWDLNSFVVVVVAMVAVGLDVCEETRRVTFSPLKSPIVSTVRHSVSENMVGNGRCG